MGFLFGAWLDIICNYYFFSLGTGGGVLIFGFVLTCLKITPCLFVLTLPPFGVWAADLGNLKLLGHSPYTRKVLSAYPDATSAGAGSFIAIVHFPLGGNISQANAVVGQTPLLPAPVAGASPITTLRDADWVGQVSWFDANSNQALDPGFKVFEGGVAYFAKIVWAPAGQSERLPSTGAAQISRGVYRKEDHTQERLKVPATNLSPTLSSSQQLGSSSDSAQDSAMSHTVTSTYTSLAIAGETPRAGLDIRPIVLPDLGGEIDATTTPSKKIDKPIDQAPYNAQAGIPNPSMRAMPLGAPSAGGGVGAMGGAGFLQGPPIQAGRGGGVPIPAVNVGDAGAGASIAPTSTNIRFESKNYLGHIGLNYLSPGATYGLGVKANGAYLLGKTVALGANLALNKNMKEAVLSGVWMPEGTHLKAKISGSYMTGQQNFNFYSGNANANLSQASYYFSTDYVVPKEQSGYLHSVGVSTWGSQARQTNNPDPVYSVVQTPNAYQIMMDPLKLAVGTLQGEALNAQVGITKQIIAKASAGYEVLKFPFSDGTQETNKRIYQDYVAQYQPTEQIVLQAGYKLGAATNNVMLSASYAQWKLTGFKNTGVNGVVGNQGATLTYSIPLDGSVRSVAFGALTRPEIIGNSAYILRDAATRPIQLPQTFLAKVDTTAVRTVASINKAGLPNGATVDAAGNVLVLVGVGGGVVTQVTRNGASYVYAPTMQIVGVNLMIKTRLLPAAVSNGDAYVVSVTDSGGTPYLVNIATQN